MQQRYHGIRANAKPEVVEPCVEVRPSSLYLRDFVALCLLRNLFDHAASESTARSVTSATAERSTGLADWEARSTAGRPRSGRCNSRGSRGGERSEPSRDPRNRHPPRADRGAVALCCERERTRISIMGQRSNDHCRDTDRGLEKAPPERLLRRRVRLTTRRARRRPRRSLPSGLRMRPLRGRRVTAGGSAGHARARCTRPRATHGYFIDRSAVAAPQSHGGTKYRLFGDRFDP